MGLEIAGTLSLEEDKNSGGHRALYLIAFWKLKPSQGQTLDGNHSSNASIYLTGLAIGANSELDLKWSQLASATVSKSLYCLFVA